MYDARVRFLFANQTHEGLALERVDVLRRNPTRACQIAPAEDVGKLPRNMGVVFAGVAASANVIDSDEQGRMRITPAGPDFSSPRRLVSFSQRQRPCFRRLKQMRLIGNDAVIMRLENPTHALRGRCRSLWQRRWSQIFAATTASHHCSPFPSPD